MEVPLVLQLLFTELCKELEFLHGCELGIQH
jgi:hypothetical protein